MMSPTAHITQSAPDGIEYVRTEPAPALPPPMMQVGALGWLRANLFSSIPNVLLTLVVVAFLAWVIPPMIRFLFIDAVWSGADREACVATESSGHIGACWAFV